MLGPLGMYPRFFLVAGGSALIKPGIYTDLFGMAVLAAIFLLQYHKIRRSKEADSHFSDREMNIITFLSFLRGVGGVYPW
jgi:UPF0716 family protein affecting phage T7 exclusion